MKKRISLRKIYIISLSFCAFLTTILNVSYIRLFSPTLSILSYVSTLFTVFGTVLFFFRMRLKSNKKIFLFFFFFFYLFFVTMIGNGSLITCLKLFARIISCCFLVFSVEKKHERLCILKVWCFCFFVLLCADLISMILYPNYLYLSEETNYRCWFLGYKTDRMFFLYPLLIMMTYVQFAENKKMKIRHLLVFLLVIISVSYSRGTSALIAVLFYLACIPFVGVYKLNKKNVIIKVLSRFVNLLTNYFLVFGVYFFVFISVVLLQSNSKLINQIAGLTHKSVTFSGRMDIWARAINYISDHLLFGSGILSAEQYTVLTNGFINPHNIILTYLISGGVIGFLLFFAVIYLDFRGLTKDRTNICLIIGIIGYLILGISSSTLAFCPYYFVIILLGLLTQQKN